MARIGREWLEIYFENGVDVQNRRIFLIGEISEDTASDVIKGMYLMQAMSIEKPITIYIYTEGGSEYAMFAIYDVIKQCACDVETVAMGEVLSAGPILVAAGTKGKRYSLPNTFFMVHESWDTIGDVKLSDNKNIIKHHSALENRWLLLMEENTGISRKKWQKMCSGPDKYFDATKAVELGIVDYIWDEDGGD